MLTQDFAYDLPEELIAQTPIEPRDASRMLVLHRDTRRIEHRRFSQLVDYLMPGDLLVANETRVIPARIEFHKVPSGGRVELLLLKRQEPMVWEVLVKGRKVLPGQRLAATGHHEQRVEGIVVAVTPSGGRLVRFDEPIEHKLDDLGIMPLPPYIHRSLQDTSRYQTVYARAAGSAAAPTAGLHFTNDLIRQCQSMGVDWVPVLLHIGLDTFRPVSEKVVEEHQIHTEYCHLSEEAAKRINKAKAEGRRVIAVGTTAVRVLETAAQGAEQGVRPWQGPTQLFIYPGYRFCVVDALITNFHLPRSSLLMLVSAFADLASIKQAYQVAVDERYRFYSFGDAMLLL